MEEISKIPHPNIITYHGCNVRRGRITSIVLEKLDQTLTQYIATQTMPRLDYANILQQLNNALAYIHSLGLAHNINPDNIMIKNRSAILIGFGSCQPVGNRLRSLGTEGWYKEEFILRRKSMIHIQWGSYKNGLRSKCGKARIVEVKPEWP